MSDFENAFTSGRVVVAARSSRTRTGDGVGPFRGILRGMNGFLVVVGLGVLGAWPAIGSGQSPAVGPNAPATLIQVIELEERVERLERSLSGMVSEAMRGQEVHERELRALRDELERLQRRVEEVERDPSVLAHGSRGRAGDADPGPSHSAPGSAIALSEADAANLYQSGLVALRDGRNREAAQAFDRYIEVQPEGAFAADAWYWLGETRSAARDRVAAIETFGTVVERFPDSERAPEAWLQIGILHAERDERDAARRAFETLIERYPEHPSARLARDRLSRL